MTAKKRAAKATGTLRASPWAGLEARPKARAVKTAAPANATPQQPEPPGPTAPKVIRIGYAKGSPEAWREAIEAHRTGENLPLLARRIREWVSPELADYLAPFLSKRPRGRPKRRKSLADLGREWLAIDNARRESFYASLLRKVDPTHRKRGDPEPWEVAVDSVATQLNVSPSKARDLLYPPKDQNKKRSG